MSRYFHTLIRTRDNENSLLLLILDSLSEYYVLPFRLNTGLLRNLENLENLEKSGNLIFDQKIRENSGNLRI